MKTFEHFPETSVCPICGTSEDKPCTLVTIDGTNDGNRCEAQPVHVDCLVGEWRYNKECGVIYKRVSVALGDLPENNGG